MADETEDRPVCASVLFRRGETAADDVLGDETWEPAVAPLMRSYGKAS